ncbi:hypothetical protein HY632_03465 [Candidatus Uhrbacteria bacterium]|nr:hypothetical protein [Candidatus Uhrbacteria bacterium]
MHPNPRMVNVLATSIGGGAIVYLSMCTLVPAFGALPALGVSIVLGAIIGYIGPHVGSVIAAIPEAAEAAIPKVATAASAARAGLRTFFRGFRPMFWYSVMVAIAVGWASHRLTTIHAPEFAQEDWTKVASGWWDLPWTIPVLIVFIAIAASKDPLGDFPIRSTNRALTILLGCLFAIVAALFGRIAHGALGAYGSSIYAAILGILACWLLPSIFVDILLTEKRTEQWANRLSLRYDDAASTQWTKAWEQITDPEQRAIRDEIMHDSRTFERQLRTRNLLSDPFAVLPWWTPLVLSAQAFDAIVRWSIRFLWAMTSGLLWHWPIALGTFFVTLVRIVHTEVRLMCAVDVPLGGMTAYAVARVTWGEQFTNLPGILQLGMSLGAGMLTLGIVLLNMKIIAPLIAKTPEQHPNP